MLDLASRQTVILVRSTSSANLRVLGAALERRDGEFRGLVEPQRLRDVPAGATVLLEIRPEDAAWLNAHRPVIVSLRLKLVAWCSVEDAEVIAKEAPDFWDWVSHLVEAPGGPHRFTRRGMACAGERIAWTGGALSAMWEARGEPEPPHATLDADAEYLTMLESARAPERWLLIEGLTGPEQLERIEWALAEARRTSVTVLVQPEINTPGWMFVHDRTMGWREASDMLRRTLGTKAESIALCLDLEPEAVYRIAQHGDQLSPDAEHIWEAEDPAVAMLRRGLAPPTEDALSWRAGMVELPPPGEVQSALEESRPSWSRLSVLAMRQEQWSVARSWANTAEDTAQHPDAREQAARLQQYIDARVLQKGPIPLLGMHELPPLPNGNFVGRTKELERIDDWIGRQRETSPILLITGMAGVGKTRLVLEFAYRVQHEYETIVWISAAGRDLEAVIEAIDRRLDLDSAERPRSIEGRAERIRTALENKRRTLLVIDGVEDGRSLQGWLPRTGGTKVLVTSQSWLDDPNGAHTFVLGPTPKYDILQHLERAKDTGPSESLKAGLARSLASVSAKERDLLAVMASLADAAVPTRLLNSTLRVLWDEEIEPNALELIQQRLVSRGFVSSMEVASGFHLHPLVWATARDLASDRHRQAVRHALADEVRIAQQSSLAFLVLHKYRAHIEFLVADMEGDDTEEELTLARGWSILLRGEGEFDRALEWCERLASRTEGAPHAVFLLEASIVLAEQGHFLDALRRLRQASTLLEHLEESDVLNSEVLRAKGRIHSSQRQFDQARSDHEQALSLVRTAHLRAPENGLILRELSLALIELGDLVMNDGHADEALELFEESYRIARQFFDQYPEGWLARHELSIMLGKVGDAQLALQKVDEALEAYTQSVDFARDLLSRAPQTDLFLADLSNALANLGDAHLHLGAYARAEQCYAEGLELAQRLVGPEPGARALLYLASFLRRAGDASQTMGSVEAALRAFSQSVDLIRPLVERGSAGVEARHDLAVLLSRVGGISVQMGNAPAAVHAYEESLDLIRQLALEDPSHARTQHERIHLSGMLADAHQRAGDYSKALAAYAEGLEVARRRTEGPHAQPEDWFVLSSYLADVAELKLRVGQVESAIEVRREQIELGRRIDEHLGTPQIRIGLARSLVRLATAYLTLGDSFPEALAPLREALALIRGVMNEQEESDSGLDLGSLLREFDTALTIYPAESNEIASLRAEFTSLMLEPDDLTPPSR